MNQATHQPMPEISATELKQRLDNGDDIQIIDVREANEVAIAKIPNSIHIPLGQILNRMSEIDPTVKRSFTARWAAAAPEQSTRSSVRVSRQLAQSQGRHHSPGPTKWIQACRSIDAVD